MPEVPATETVAAPVSPVVAQAPVAVPTQTAPAPAANGAKKTAKKAAPKAAKAAPVKKAAPAAKKTGKAPKASNGKQDRGINNTQIAALKLLARGTPLSRAKISERLGGTFIGGRVMGHADPKKCTKTSLIGRGYARFSPKQKEDDREDICYYEITAAGRKSLESL